MSASELLDQIERSGLIEVRTLTKLRREIQLKGHHVKPKAIIKYLVAKGHLTEGQAADFLAGRMPVSAGDPSAFEVEQRVEREFDTDDLTMVGGRAAPPPSQSPAPTPSRGGNRNGGRRVPDGPTRQYQPKDLEGTTASAQGLVEPPAAVVARAEMADPFLGPQAGFAQADPGVWDGGSAAEEHHEPLSFSGKIDKSDQWKTKWMFVGSAVLALLLIALGVLAWYMFQIDADQLLGRAEQEYTAANFSSAGPTYEQFIEKFPRHERANYARVRAFHCRLILPFGGRNYGEVYKLAEEWLPQLQDFPDFSVIQEDLSLILVETTLRLTQVAMAQQNIEDVKSALARAQAANALVQNPIYVNSSSRRISRNTVMLEQIENNIKTIEGLIQKEEVYREAVSEIGRETAAGNTAKAFGVYTRLTRTYGDLASRTELRDVMKSVSEREVELVQPVQLNLPTSSDDVAANFAAKHLLVAHQGSAIERVRGEMLPLLIAGNVYGIDSASGAIVWHRHVGWETRIAPQWVDRIDQQDIIACDQRTHEIMRLSMATGELIWRTTVGTRFSAPTVTAAAIYLATDDGNVIALDPQTGTVTAAVKVPKRVTVSPEADDQSQLVFVAGYDSNVYVLDRTTLECRGVFYAGHAAGAVGITPMFWSGFLVVALNGSDYCELLAIQVADEGRSLQRVQTIRLASGPVTMNPQRLGRLVLYISENGEIKLVELNATEPENPVRILAEQKFDANRGEEVFVSSEGSDLWIGAKGIMHYRVLRSQGQINREKIVEPLDTFLGIVGKVESRVYHLRQRLGSRQIRLAAGDASSLKDISNTDFGGVLAGSPVHRDGQVVAITSQGNVFTVDASDVANSQPRLALLASEIDQPMTFLNNVVLPNGRIVCVGGAGSADMVSVDPAVSKLQLVRLPSPAEAMACPPIAFGNHVLTCSLRGQVIRIDAETGRMVGTPFQPPLAPGQEIRWNRPVALDTNRLLVADGAANLYLLRADGDAALIKASELALNGDVVSDLAAIGNVGCFVIRVNQQDALQWVSCQAELTAIKAVNLPGRVVAGPFAIDGGFAVVCDDGQIHAYSENGEASWRQPASTARLAGMVSLGEGNTLVAWEDGSLSVVDRAGEIAKELELGQPIRHAPTLCGQYMVFGTLDAGLIFVELGRLQ